MQTMEEIQLKLLSALHNNKCKYVVSVDFGTSRDGTLYTGFHVYNWKDKEIVRSMFINFYDTDKVKWNELLDECLAIMRGETDPFKEDKANEKHFYKK